MTQPTEAVGGEPIVDSQLTPEDRLSAAFDDPANHQEDDPAPEEGEQPAAEGAEDETGIEEEADDLPPIDAPVSWDNEAKGRFAKLPRDDQEYLAKRESERERFVQQKSQEATRAKQEALSGASAQLAQIEQGYAEQWHQHAQSIQPQRPDPALLVTNQYEYVAQQQRYEEAIAQREQAQLTAQHYARQAQQREAQVEQAFNAEQHQLIVENFPEYTDPTNGPKIQQELTAVARDLGYPPELISQARATDIIAMRTAAEWKAKAAKYDALQSQKMEKVRAARGKPPITAKPGSAQAPGATRQHQYSQDRDALRQGDQAATQRVLDSFFTKPK